MNDNLGGTSVFATRAPTTRSPSVSCVEAASNQRPHWRMMAQTSPSSRSRESSGSRNSPRGETGNISLGPTVPPRVQRAVPDVTSIMVNEVANAENMKDEVDMDLGHVLDKALLLNNQVAEKVIGKRARPWIKMDRPPNAHPSSWLRPWTGQDGHRSGMQRGTLGRRWRDGQEGVPMGFDGWRTNVLVIKRIERPDPGQR